MPDELKKGDRVKIEGRKSWATGTVQEIETPDTLPTIGSDQMTRIVFEELRRGGCKHIAILTFDYAGETRACVALQLGDDEWRDLRGQRLRITPMPATEAV